MKQGDIKNMRHRELICRLKSRKEKQSEAFLAPSFNYEIRRYKAFL